MDSLVIVVPDQALKPCQSLLLSTVVFRELYQLVDEGRNMVVAQVSPLEYSGKAFNHPLAIILINISRLDKRTEDINQREESISLGAP